MKTPKLLLVALAFAVSTSFVDASDVVRLGGYGFVVQMVPADPGAVSSGRVATADCSVRINQQNIVLHWATSPFVHTDFPEVTSDAVLAATLTGQVGSVSVTPQSVVDRTDIHGGDDSASVAMGIQGNGKLDIKLEVGIDDPSAGAGKQCATVIMTVTGY